MGRIDYIEAFCRSSSLHRIEAGNRTKKWQPGRKQSMVLGYSVSLLRTDFFFFLGRIEACSKVARNETHSSSSVGLQILAQLSF